MPELPDLCVFSQNLKKRILHKTITGVTVFNIRSINTPAFFSDMLTGTTVQDIVREGKELHFLLANQNSFGVHLMLSGRFDIIPNQADLHKINAKIVALCFEDTECFVISDIGGLCKVTLNPRPSATPDALSDTFTFEYFLSQIRKKAGVNIKAFLIDQHIVRGIGNAYVDEILWKANISPESVAGKIPEEKLRELFQVIPFVLNDAIRNIQNIAPDIISGEERSFLKVHNPRLKCTEDGDSIIRKQVAGKTTYFTGKQELFK
jgi:formamidopyrimidine-DNA glycosylase